MDQLVMRQLFELGLAGIVMGVQALAIRHLYRRCEKLEDDRLAEALKSQEQIGQFVNTIKVVLTYLKDGGG